MTKFEESAKLVKKAIQFYLKSKSPLISEEIEALQKIDQRLESDLNYFMGRRLGLLQPSSKKIIYSKEGGIHVVRN